MSAAAEIPDQEPPKGKRRLVPLLVVLVLGAAGFASTFLGLWSPAALLETVSDRGAAEAAPEVVFVDVPRIELNIPGGRGRVLVLSTSIETDQAQQGEILHLMPRVSDAFATFLSGIDPGAYDKRGVLEIIRGELLTRSRYVLGEAPVKDLLITEFLIR
ncbi:flagellar basal body-associated FliL family protein [Paracoccus marinaquae]|uniref:Flagellar protein FliL n=1 Tax=Paracoccus marinaquae TaxID=2841926 RepID=A0ABS6AF92_9RHOB|nr:flagellar basal body-associated FliL family protein [Paracoccus marinaquae]MBU3028612.1 flagellar basal body-associated FliL family protein [Paracoccus marinaquae]